MINDSLDLQSSRITRTVTQRSLISDFLCFFSIFFNYPWGGRNVSAGDYRGQKGESEPPEVKEQHTKPLGGLVSPQ